MPYPSTTKALPCWLVLDLIAGHQFKLLCLVIIIALHQNELVVPVRQAQSSLLEATFGIESPTLH